jgi:hypothetical protein
MTFNQENNIVKLIIKGMEMEAVDSGIARTLYLQAWNEASGDFEKSTAAHYLARQQDSKQKKLSWDETALTFALKTNDQNIQSYYPSLYLNIARGYEDLDDLEKAAKNYRLALSHCKNLAEDSYGQMIRSGIQNGLARTSRVTEWRTGEDPE